MFRTLDSQTLADLIGHCKFCDFGRRPTIIIIPGVISNRISVIQSHAKYGKQFGRLGDYNRQMLLYIQVKSFLKSHNNLMVSSF